MKKVRRTKVEQIKRIIIALVLCIMFTAIRRPTPNQKGSAGEHGTMCVTWVGNISAGLQESSGENPMLRSHIDHCLETWLCIQNLQRGTIRRRQWQSWKAHGTIEEMVMATVQMGEYM
jgi:hypothetical protein